jgi:hypothetical protein
MPSPSGSMTSRMTASGVRRMIAVRAACTESAVSTLKPT